MHSAPWERQCDGTQAIDYDGVGTAINIAIVTESSIDPDTNTLFTSLTEVSGTNYWGLGGELVGSKTCALDGSNNLVFDAADPTIITQSAGGFSTGRSLVLYETTNNYIICHFTAATVFGNTVDDLTITYDAAGIWKMNI